MIKYIIILLKMFNTSINYQFFYEELYNNKHYSNIHNISYSNDHLNIYLYHFNQKIMTNKKNNNNKKIYNIEKTNNNIQKNNIRK